MSKNPIYLDYNATTPVDSRVLEAMLPVFSEHFGNPSSSTHAFGWYAEELVNIAREEVANLIGAKTEEIVFTSGATEANNLATLGLAQQQNQKPFRVLSAKTEHRSVLDPLDELAACELAAVTSFLPVNEQGEINIEKFTSAIGQGVNLVSLMLANNEIGVIHDIRQLSSIAHQHGALFHCDATQAIGKLKVSVDDLGVDLLSLSAHKFYGPKGVGALYVRGGPRKLKLKPLIHGGGHESGLRSGTLNVPGIVGLGRAASIASEQLASDVQHLSHLSRYFWNKLKSEISNITLNGPKLEHRLVGNLNIAFNGLDSAMLIGQLSGVLALSASSACQSASKTPSHVLSAIGLADARQRSSLRFGLGRSTTEAELDLAARVIGEKVKTLRT